MSRRQDVETSKGGDVEISRRRKDETSRCRDDEIATHTKQSISVEGCDFLWKMAWLMGKS